jgi:hypothetical protein
MAAIAATLARVCSRSAAFYNAPDTKVQATAPGRWWRFLEADSSRSDLRIAQLVVMPACVR